MRDVGFDFFCIMAEIMAQDDREQLIAALKEREITGVKLCLYWFEQCNENIATLRAHMDRVSTAQE